LQHYFNFLTKQLNNKNSVYFDPKCQSSFDAKFRGAENDGHKNGGPSKCPGMNLTNVKLTDQVFRHEIDRHENEGQI